ncbi:MAG TPA: AAA family ATPase, partial [Planctomycetota bacterium]|nr:AAA family ATPase [Planctomycetota bacterium]
MSLVVVGTDTEVGKTVVSAIVVSRFSRGRRMAYWKPIATGAAEGPTDRERVARWVGREA